LVFGGVVGIGVVLIFRSELHYSYGIIIALISAVTAAVFSIINSFHVKRAHYQVITFYEMVGAFVFAVVVLPLMSGEQGIQLVPSLADWGYLLILSVVCTVVAFSFYVDVLDRLSVFTVNFANNLEPVYGIVLAALILNDHRYLGPGFYVGASVIVVSMIAYPWVRRRMRRFSREAESRR